MKHDVTTPPVSHGPQDRADPGVVAEEPEAGRAPVQLPPPPDVLATIFAADRLPVVLAFADLLATDGVVRGLIGPREAPRLWDRHIVNCGLMAAALPRDATLADIGSGAGLPGLVLAIARPDVHVTLIEPLLRRTTFLEEAVEKLGLTNVTVRRGRADAFHGELTFDVVTARAVAALDTLVAWCLPLVAPHGSMLAMKGSSAEEEVAAAAEACRRLGATTPVIEEWGGDLVVPEELEPIRLVRLSWADPARVSLPVRADRAPRGKRGLQARKKRRKP